MFGRDICLNFGLKVIYDHADFLIKPDSKVGIVGINGSGKTTLFKVIMGLQPLDSGKIEYRGTIGYLPQVITIPSEDISVFDYLLESRPIAKIKAEIAELYLKVVDGNDKDNQKILKKIGNLEMQLDYYDQYNAENTLMEIIENMQISSETLDLKLSNLSGGQKSKIAFAALLYAKANIFLLDEPTNHLDAKTRAYVINYLKNYQGMVLVISHDTEFLNEIVDNIMQLDAATHKINIYEGSYDKYLKTKASLEKAMNQQIAREDYEIKKMRDFVLQYSNSSGKRKRIAESREKLLAKKELNRTQKPPTLKQVRMNFGALEANSKIPLQVSNLTFGYTKKLYQNLSFTVNDKERFLIIGENGVGKSTLLKLLVGFLEAQSGEIKFGSKTKLAYYAQEQENLNLDATIFENMDDGKSTYSEICAVLGSFLFSEWEFKKKVKYLSPGERARLNLARLVLMKANLLLLDEPTNHLDPETQEIIGNVFKNYPGTIILVSHNQAFISAVQINRVLALPSGKISNYDNIKNVD